MISLFGFRVAAVCLDCDGVLVDSEPASEAAWLGALEGFGVNVEGFERWVGRTDAEIARHYARELGVPTEEVACAAAAAFEAELAGGIRAFPDALALVDRLSAQGVSMAVVSNSSRERLELVLSAAGIADRFPVRVSSSDVRAPKPAPDVYQVATALLETERCLALEDSPPGIAAARAAGMPVVAVHRGVFSPEELAAADRVVTDLGDG